MTQCLDKLHEMRDALEEKYKIRLPIIVHLKGNSLRVGKMDDYSVKLSKGDTFRVFQSKKIIGSCSACYCDLGDHFKKLKYGDILKIGYGRYNLKVIGKETMEQAENQIGEDRCKLASPSKSQSRFGFNLVDKKWTDRVLRKLSDTINEEMPLQGSKTMKAYIDESDKSFFAPKTNTSQRLAAISCLEKTPRNKQIEQTTDSVQCKKATSHSGGSCSSSNMDDSICSLSKVSNSAASSF